MTGFYAMTRGWMDHPALAEKEYNKQTAWAWLIENAAWKDHSIFYQGKLVPLARGDVPASFRSLATAWGWSVNRVSRYISVLEMNTMVERKTDTPFMVLSIVNYDKYQTPSEKADTATDTRSDTDTDTRSDTNRRNKQINKKTNNPLTPKGDAATLSLLGDEPEVRAPEPAERFMEFYSIWPKRKGIETARRAFAKAVKERTVEQILAAARNFISEYEADMRPKSEKFQYVPYPATWLNRGDYKSEELLPGDYDGPAWENPALSDFERKKLYGRAHGFGENYTPADWGE